MKNYLVLALPGFTLVLGMLFAVAPLEACGGATGEGSSSSGETADGLATDGPATSVLDCVDDAAGAGEPCGPGGPNEQDGPFPSQMDLGEGEIGIVPTADMELLDPTIAQNFDRYTHIVAPSGRLIRLLAQSEVTDAQLVRARKILSFFLTDVEGTTFGADKSAIANAMAKRRATLLFFNDEATAEAAMEGKLGELDLFGQDLYATESVVDASDAWLDNSVRDATLEEIFHLVHGAGIEPAMPGFQLAIREAADHAIAQGVWTPPADLLQEWIEEGSDDKEYITSVIDVYYGLWAHQDGPAFWGEYQPNSREALATQDPEGMAVVEAFLPPNFTYAIDLAKTFTGTFDMEMLPSTPYTHKSRYMIHVQLTGELPSGFFGNDRDNVFRGNTGKNDFNGANGIDTVIFSGTVLEYIPSYDMFDPTILIMDDTVLLRDGTDRLRSIEMMQFSDQTVPSGL